MNPLAGERTVTARRRKLLHGQTCDSYPVAVTFNIIENGGNRGKPILHVSKGGVTGYEGYYVADLNIAKIKEEGIYLCAGTTGSWDELYLSGDQFALVCGHFSITEKDGRQ